MTLNAADDLRTDALKAVADGADALGMAGGDGSLATVAASQRRTGCPSSASPAGLGTTLRWTWVWIGATCRGLDAFTDGVEA